MRPRPSPLSTAAVAVAAALALAATATAGVRVVDRIDLEAASKEGAIGLAVPGAGPTVTRTGALRTLLTGEVQSSYLGGAESTSTPPRIELDGAEPPEGIEVVLPPAGRSANDVRYPIAVAGGGATGVLTSDSTRIVGLVSLADVANGELEWVEVDDPVATLAALNERIDRNDRIRTPLTLLLVFGSIAISLVAPRWAPRIVLLALAANLWLAGWWLVALLAAAALLLPLGWACAAVVLAYLAVLGLDPEAVALSPFGPSQAGRFYGLSNLLATWLLLPAVVGVALLARRSRALAVGLGAAALAAVGSSRLGADGGGLLVLLAAYGTLALRLGDVRLGVRRVVALAAAVVAAGVALVALDAALGASSHVTEALGDGPGAVLADLVDRLELSWRRATSSGGAIAATLTGLVGLVWVATRRPHLPATDALLVAVVVSLVVNDTPTDVASVGATVAFLVRRFEAGSPSTRPVDLDRLRAMRRSTIVAASLLAALGLALAGCTSGEEVGATPETVEGEIPTQEGPSAEDLPALELTGDPAAGAEIWTAQGCGACHTLSAAGSTGTVGPNLDEAKPSYDLAVERITLGQGGMPAFGDKLDPQQIADVAQYVVDSTGG